MKERSSLVLLAEKLRIPRFGASRLRKDSRAEMDYSLVKLSTLLAQAPVAESAASPVLTSG